MKPDFLILFPIVAGNEFRPAFKLDEVGREAGKAMIAAITNDFNNDFMSIRIHINYGMAT